MNPEKIGFKPEQTEAKQETLEAVETLQAENAELKEQLKQSQDKIAELEKLAYFDSKTGILNLNGLKLNLERKQLGRPENAKTTRGSMLVLDIDNFKIVNDAFGHDVGDEILKAVASHLKSSVRKTDLVARWGGEEFVVVFDKTDSEGIINKLYQKKDGEEVGRARVNVQTSIEGKETTITLSGGVTDFNMDDDMGEVFKRADQALYEAKRAGKDRVIESRE